MLKWTQLKDAIHLVTQKSLKLKGQQSIKEKQTERWYSLYLQFDMKTKNHD